MIKRNLKTLTLTSIILLLPIVAGLLLWNQLPEQVPTHWGIDGEVDAWSSKAFAVFGLPCILLVVHWICVFASSADPKIDNYHPAMLLLVLWICPVISLLLSSLMYAVALGHPLDVEVIMPLFVGALFLIIGNLLPKCRQTYTMGIKLPWTLDDEGNWNATHRFGGWVMVLGGAFTMITAFLGNFWLLLGILIVIVAAPTIYSYLYYRKHRK